MQRDILKTLLLGCCYLASSPASAAQDSPRDSGEYRCQLDDRNFGSVVPFYEQQFTYVPAHSLGWIFSYLNDGTSYHFISSRLDDRFFERERIIQKIDRETLETQAHRWVIDPRTGSVAKTTTTGTCKFVPRP